MKPPKPNRRQALNSAGVWRQRALTAENALRIMVFHPDSAQAQHIRKMGIEAYESKGLPMPKFIEDDAG